MWLRFVLGFLFFLVQLTDSAGQFIGNGAILHIQENAEFTTEYQLESNGFLANDGLLRLKADWINRGIYQGAGTILLNGAIPQRFAHNGDPVEIFQVSNPSGARLDGFLPVPGTLVLESGIIQTSASDTLLLLTQGEIKGGSDQSYIYGPLHRVGRGMKFFPVGDSDIYLPLTFTDITGGNTTTVVNVQKNFNGTPPPGISEIVRSYYWERNNYGDAFSGSGVILPLFENGLERETLVVLGLEGAEYNLYRDLTFSSGQYYTDALVNTPVTESILLLAKSEDVVRDEAAFYVPNVLSPNADDPENRVIKVYGELSDEDFSFVVYDRRGIEVYSSENLDRAQNVGWNGTSYRTGELLPAGTYVYAVNARNLRGEAVKKTGTVTLIR